jgi:hypothetical protein
MKILLGDIKAKIGMEEIFKMKTGNESLHNISNNIGVMLLNYATSKAHSQKYFFQDCNIHKFNWMSLMENPKSD